MDVLLRCGRNCTGGKMTIRKIELVKERNILNSISVLWKVYIKLFLFL
jgi:hypothetical protein